MHEDDVGPRLREHGFHPLEHARRDLRERLVVGHDVEIVVRHDRKELEQVVEHLPVLRGHAYQIVDGLLSAQRVYDRSHLDRIGARPEHGHDAQLAVIHL